MKNLFKFGIAAFMMMGVMSACTKEKEAEQPTLQVEFKMPEGFTAAFEGNVTISSKDLNKEYTVEAKAGVATFEDIYPGIYQLQAQARLTKAEAQAAAPGLNIMNDILLNGVGKDIQVILNEQDNLNVAAVNLKWSVESSLLISKIYGNGTKLNNGKGSNHPKYWEIYNNSAEVVYLDGLCFAQAHGNTTGGNPCRLYQNFQDEATYAARIARFPGEHGKDKSIALEPGKSIAIAWNASDFLLEENSAEGATDQCTMNVDLSHADYEIESTGFFWKKFGDNPNVPNLKPVYDCVPTAGFLQMNQAVFIFFATEAEIESWATDYDDMSYSVASQQKWMAKRVPNDIIIDAVETWKKDAEQQKRIADVLDAKGIEDDNNSGSIFDRRIQYIAESGRKVLQDTNNSSVDFVVVESRNPEKYDGSHLVIKDYDKPEIQPAN